MIQCPLCRKENPEAHRFCIRCAKDLSELGGGSVPGDEPAEGAPCANCDKRNGPGHRFCHGCGIPLSGAPAGGRTETTLSLTRSGTSRREILHIRPDGSTVAYPLEKEVRIGRADATLCFPDDKRMSRAHAAVKLEGDQAVLEDLGSTNGTFVRVRGEVELRPGDVLLLGDQLFQYLV